jgi:2-polyprenyl-6-methoxyphenol hydroxylase-like FAD-dependent oxidoreductase
MVMADTSVLVVGAGPVGLCMALELGFRGQDVLILDEGDGSVDHPRAGGVSIRTMEFFRRWGIVDDIRNCGFPDDYDLDIVFSTGLNGYELIREPYPSLGQMPTPAESPERRQRCPQMWLDPILAQAALRHPSVQLRYHTRVDRLEIDEHSGVLAFCTNIETGEQFTHSARYAVACDGATSAVRADLGIGSSGIPLLNYSVGVFFRSPDLLKITGQHDAARFIFVSPSGPVGNLTVVDGKDLWRFTYMAGKERLDLDALDVQGIMRDVLGDKVDIEILSIAPWRRSQLVADAYRSGPVFLVGDSAHTMSPTGGFGANTGFGEAVDLGWKLDAVLRGWGGEGLLDSYEVERRPIAIRNTAAATSNFKGWYSKADLSRLLEPGAEGDQLRKAVGEELVEGTRAEWESKGVILGYRYENSPICLSDGTPEPPDDNRVYVPTNRPGHRAPHAWLSDGRSTLDLFGDGFVLLDLGEDGDPLPDLLLKRAHELGVPMRRESLPTSLETLYQSRLTLVRPDGHVAWRGDVLPDELDELLRIVTGRLSLENVLS